MEEDIKLLEDFKNNNFQKDKLEKNEKGGFKIGTIYKTTELNPAIENLTNKYKELEADLYASNSIINEYIENNKEQEKMIELMTVDLMVCGTDFVSFGMFTGNLKKDKELVIEHYKKKAKGE